MLDLNTKEKIAKKEMTLVAVTKESLFNEPANKKVGNNATKSFSTKSVRLWINKLSHFKILPINQIKNDAHKNNKKNNAAKNKPKKNKSVKLIWNISSKTASSDTRYRNNWLTRFKINKNK